LQIDRRRWPGRGAALGLCWLALAVFPGGAGAAAPAAERAPDLWEKFGVVEFADGQPAPAFALQDLDGRTHALADFKGQVVAVNFWATWCTPCEWEMPSMEVLHRRYRGKPFVLLGVSVDTGAADIFVRPYVKGKTITFQILLDPTLKTSRAYRVRGLPTTFFVGPDGQLLGQVHGPRDWTTPEAFAFIDHLLARGR